MINFSKIAYNSVSGNSMDNSIMYNRTKLSTDEAIGAVEGSFKYLTIIQFDVKTSRQGSRYSVVNFEEFPNHYYCGGKALTDICDQWIEAYQGDIVQANMDLKESGGCKVKIEKVRTSKGNPFIKFTIIY